MLLTLQTAWLEALSLSKSSLTSPLSVVGSGRGSIFILRRFPVGRQL